MNATELTLPHIFGNGIVLVLNFPRNRRSSEQALE